MGAFFPVLAPIPVNSAKTSQLSPAPQGGLTTRPNDSPIPEVKSSVKERPIQWDAPLFPRMSAREIIEELRSILQSLNLQHPEADVFENVRKQDYRFMAVCGIACSAPGVSRQEVDVSAFGLNNFANTSDDNSPFNDDEYLSLLEQAWTYAVQYNQALVGMIRANRIPLRCKAYGNPFFPLGLVWAKCRPQRS